MNHVRAGGSAYFELILQPNVRLWLWIAERAWISTMLMTDIWQRSWRLREQ
jgi:hypothetical protein